MQITGSGNRFLNPDILVKEALFQFTNELTLGKLVYRDLTKQIVKGRGDTVNIELPKLLDSIDGPDISGKIQPWVERSTSVTVSNHKTVAVEITAKDETLSDNQFLTHVLKPATDRLANDVETALAQAMVKGFFHSMGTPGTVIDTGVIAMTRAWMSKLGIPEDTFRNAVLDAIDAAYITNSILNLNSPQLVEQALTKGWLGQISNFKVFESGLIPAHTTGKVTGTPTVATGGWSASDPDKITISGLASGDYFNVGDVITVAGVYWVNPITKQSTGRLAQFTIVESQATSSSPADGTSDYYVIVSPEINDGTLTTTDEGGATVSKSAYQNVSAAPADGAAISRLGDDETSYRQNLIFHKNATALVVPGLEAPQTKIRKQANYDGYTITLTGDGDITSYKTIYRFDLLFGVEVIFPEFGFRLWSATA